MGHRLMNWNQRIVESGSNGRWFKQSAFCGDHLGPSTMVAARRRSMERYGENGRRSSTYSIYVLLR